MRLYETVSGATTTRLAYDGLDRIAEYDGANALQRRYVHGPGPSTGSGRADEPIVWYEGSGIADRRFLSADERGSIISVTNGSGTLLGLNRYDEFGQPQAANIGAFGYTGQAWLPTIGAWYYNARVQDPELGRFPQPDPIGYDDGMNLYAYVGNDPVNLVDPLGLQQECGVPGTSDCSPIVVVGSFGAAGSLGGGLGGGGGGGGVQVPGHSSHPPGVEGVPFDVVGKRNPRSPQKEEEGLAQCIANNTDAGGLTGAVVGGVAAVAAGAPILPKSLLTGRSGKLSGGANPSGGRTSVLSAAARGFIGPEPKLKPGGFLARERIPGRLRRL